MLKKQLNSRYSLLDLLRLTWSLLVTKIFFSPARLIRQPTRIRGFRNMKIGAGFTTGQYCRIEAANPEDKTVEFTLVIGRNVQINDSCHIAAVESIVIGENVLIASKVYVTDHDHGDMTNESLLIAPSKRELVTSPVCIEDNVWICEGVVVLKGVTIGKGSVIGAGAIVTKSIPPYSLAVGVPAKIVKKFNF